MELITVADFAKILKSDKNDYILLDVRTKEELALASIEGATHIALDQIEQRFIELNPSIDIFCLCHHGVRSEYAARFLDSKGFKRTINIIGGIESWSVSVDNTIARY